MTSCSFGKAARACLVGRLGMSQVNYLYIHLYLLFLFIHMFSFCHYGSKRRSKGKEQIRGGIGGQPRYRSIGDSKLYGHFTPHFTISSAQRFQARSTMCTILIFRLLKYLCTCCIFLNNHVNYNCTCIQSIKKGVI